MSANFSGDLSLRRRASAALIWRVAADATTLSVLGLGVLALASHERPWLFLALVAAAGLLDGIDGALAARAGGGSGHGAVLDIVADTVTFALAPASLLVTLKPPGSWALAAVVWAAVIYVGAALARLIRAARSPARMRGAPFMGLPMPGAGLFVSCLALTLPPALAGIGLLVVAGLAISRRPYPTVGEFLRRELQPAVLLGVLAMVAALLTPLAGPTVFIAGYAAYPWLTARPLCR